MERFGFISMVNIRLNFNGKVFSPKILGKEILVNNYEGKRALAFIF